MLQGVGPGLIAGASDDDPSGIGTYATAGAGYGYATLWTAPLTVPLMISVQYICAKIGLVSGMGLANALKRFYPHWVLYPAVFALFVANTINAGVDIAAIAAGLNLLVPIPVNAMIIPITLSILALQIWGSYRLILRTFKWLTLALFAYIASSFMARPDWIEVLKATFIPTIRFDSGYLSLLVAILGTTISPYLFFWQTSEEVEDELHMGRRLLRQRKGATDTELRHAGWDTSLGMVFCNLVFYFVILGTGATLFVNGKTDISSAADAALALRPLAGDAASLLFALGIIGAGFLAVPVLTGSAAYAVSEAFGWKEGLDARPARAKQFYAVIAISTLIGIEIDFLGINPVAALVGTAVINGFLAPPLLVLIMLIANNRKIMGARVNGRWLNVLGWTTTGVMSLAALLLVASWLVG
jgi:NRAMP (natural resistance-associated macrophage protein)-like metal ion transporter